MIDALKNLNILFVDDDNASIEVLVRALGKFFNRVTYTRDGQEALDYLSASDDIDVVVTDLIMPNIDGYELIKVLRDDLGSEIPIVVCSGKFSDEQQSLLAEQNVCAMAKPVRVDRLVTSIMEAYNNQQNPRKITLKKS